jgi:hypothetical protein
MTEWVGLPECSRRTSPKESSSYQRANRPRPPSAHSRCSITGRARTVKWQSEFSRNQIVVDEDLSVRGSWPSAEGRVSGDRLPALSALPKNVSREGGIHPNAEVEAEVDVVKVRRAKRLAWKAPVRTRPQKPAQAASLTPTDCAATAPCTRS